MSDPSPPRVIDLREKFDRFDDHWHPRIIGELNGQHVKIAKVKGAFVWHSHEQEDELFFVLQGTLLIDFEDRTEEVRAGEMIIVPRGIRHRPRAEEEVRLLLFEPASTVNTGSEDHPLRRDELDWI